MVTTLPVIKLTERMPIIPGAIILRKPKSRAQRFLEFQPKITPFLAGTLATLVAGPLTGAKVFLGTGLATGILTASERARTFAREKVLDPTKIGIGIGGLIEDPGRLIPKGDQTLKEKVIEVGTAAGLIGGVAAAVVGGVALGKKALEKIPKIPKIPERIAPQVLPAALLPALPSITTQPLGAVKQPVDQVPIAAPMQPINITNTFNPSIKISFKKSRKFINQQLLIR